MQVTTGRSRSEQIILATIAVLAERGWAGASFERVRAHGEMSSTRLISYHFDGKDALMRSVLAYIVADGAAHMVPAIAMATDENAALHAYIASNVAYLVERPTYARAAVEVIHNLTGPDGLPDRTANQDAVRVLAERLAAGQASGAFTRFDPIAVATAIRSTIDAVGTLIADLGDTSPATWGPELADFFDRATRRQLDDGSPTAPTHQR